MPETFIDREYAYSGRDELLKSAAQPAGGDGLFYDTTGASRRAEMRHTDKAMRYAGNRYRRWERLRGARVVPFNRDNVIPYVLPLR